MLWAFECHNNNINNLLKVNNLPSNTAILSTETDKTTLQFKSWQYALVTQSCSSSSRVVFKHTKHIICHIGDDFYRSDDPTNSVKH